MQKLLSVLTCLILCVSAFLSPCTAEVIPFPVQALSPTAVEENAETILLDGQTVTIQNSGIYILSGTIKNGQIYIDAGKDATIQLVLAGVSIHTESGAAIEIEKAGNVYITSAKDTHNSLSSAGTSKGKASAVIYSKSELTLNGPGELAVSAWEGDGIQCKDTLSITEGTYRIQSAGHGITGKDAVNIANGSFSITTGGGSKAVSLKTDDSDSSETDDKNSAKAFGIKSSGDIQISGGEFFMDCVDDAVHTKGSIRISGGSWSILSADDAFHSDSDITISNGFFQIPYCCEGIEGMNVTIHGGNYQIISHDDGINAFGDKKAKKSGKDAGAVLTVNGGNIIIVSDGDSLDSNGVIILNGGTLKLTCNGNGNFALDSDSGIINNGADVTTNDCSSK